MDEQKFMERAKTLFRGTAQSLETELEKFIDSGVQDDPKLMENAKKALELCRVILSKDRIGEWIFDYNELSALIKSNESLQRLFVSAAKDKKETFEFCPRPQRFGNKTGWTLDELKLRNPIYFTPDSIEALGTTDVRLHTAKSGRQCAVFKNHRRYADGKMHQRYTAYLVCGDGGLEHVGHFPLLVVLKKFLNQA